MKTKWVVTIIIGLLLHTAVIAQNKPRPTPEWVSLKGWWMVESNIHSPKQHIVYFYNNDGVMVYKETLEGFRLDLKKRRIKMQLKQVLEATVVAWEKERKVPGPISIDNDSKNQLSSLKYFSRRKTNLQRY